MNKVYVIAGSASEYSQFMQECVRNQRYPNSNLVYVFDEEMLRGIANPDGVFIGTWMKRPDIERIMDRLLIITHANKKFHRLMEIRYHLNNHKS